MTAPERWDILQIKGVISVDQETRTDEECLEILERDWPDYMNVVEQRLADKQPLEPLLSVLESFG